jgi:5-methylcytosine-specific restriction endonuclease McrA
LQALLCTDPNPPLAPIFGRAIELALDRYDPERRQARRELRRTRKAAPTSEGGVAHDPAFTAFHLDETSSEKNNKKSSARTSDGSAQHNAQNRDALNGKNKGRNSAPSRATLPRRGGMTPRPKIPQWLRDQVLVRDGHRCTHVGPAGRCPAVTELEIDHICPHAQGGSDHVDNLRALCRAHNQRAAEVVFGVEFMRRSRGKPPSSSRRNHSWHAPAIRLTAKTQLQSKRFLHERRAPMKSRVTLGAEVVV